MFVFVIALKVYFVAKAPKIHLLPLQLENFLCIHQQKNKKESWAATSLTSVCVSSDCFPSLLVTIFLALHQIGDTVFHAQLISSPFSFLFFFWILTGR